MIRQPSVSGQRLGRTSISMQHCSLAEEQKGEKLRPRPYDNRLPRGLTHSASILSKGVAQ